ncbi:MAG: HAMP domain-containing protein, partial [Defluviitaleaceae bacterium]|nr:HAMP domain-containing protein [Defluviitaleaceae bacterium]
MNWINNMKIRSKLIFGFGLVLIITAVIAIFSIVNMSTQASNVELLIEYPTARYNNLALANGELTEVRRIVATMAFRLGDTAALSQLYAQASRAHSYATRYLTENMESIRNDPQMSDERRVYMLRDTENALQLFYAYYDYVLENMYIAAREGIVGDAASRERADYYFTEGIRLSDAMQDVFDDLIAGTLQTKNLRVSEINQAAYSTITIMTILTAVAILLGIAISLFIASVVTKPVNEVVNILDNVSNGNFNINMKSQLTRDEIGTMTQYVYNMINVVRKMVDDISNLSHAIVDNGDIDYRIDATHYRGGYNEMMTALNDFTQSYVDETMSILDALSHVSQGDFSANMRQLPGKKAVINQTMDSFITSLNDVSAEINAMINAAAVKGEMNFVIDASKYQGDWRTIVQGLNDIAKAVDAPVSEIMNVMNQLSHGDFSNNVKGNYAGDFLQMKESVNSTISNLSGYITEISDTLTRIADGDLTVSITRDYVGSFVAIKNSLNNISKTLHKTMSEITSASEQVLSGAKQISASSMDLANGASTQASSIEELNA